MRIGEIEKRTGLSAGTVRYWEERGLLSFDRTENSYRDISDETVSLLKKIKLFRELGIAIADIKLWRDNIISETELLCACKFKLEADSRSNLEQRELCERLISGNFDFDGQLENIFDEVKDTPGKLSLGVDIGTTSISAKLVSLENGKALHTYTITHNAAISLYFEGIGLVSDAFCADAEKLIDLALGLVRSAVDSYPEIVSVGFTGQMHGIVFLDENNNILSPLYTWQNQFGMRKISNETVCDVICKKAGVSIPTGYGITTFYALRESSVFGKNMIPCRAKKIALIADLAATKLCGISEIYSHPTNAASLGAFDIENNEFDSNILNALGIDREMLPKVADDFCVIGEYKGIKVSAAIGDNQAGVFGSLSQSGDVLLNVGTSGQVSFISSEKINLRTPCCELRPYIGGLLYSGATLCAGKAYSLLADFVFEILNDFGLYPTRTEVYEHLNISAQKSDNLLNISTTFLGSRAKPDKKGSITNITTSNFNLSELSGGFLRGIIEELYELYNLMSNEKPKRLIVSGNAMRNNLALRNTASEIFGCKTLIPIETEEAALGAALYAAICAKETNLESAKANIVYKEI